MESQLHTVLGARGASGHAVVDELQSRNLPVRAVTRSSRINGVENRHADLLSLDSTIAAIQGSSHVYLCVGLPYDIKVWSSQWPVIMENVIEACAQNKAALIFLDNIYMYEHPLPFNFDETTHISPSSQKGKVRKQLAEQLTSALASKRIKGVIGRSADFYGRRATNSMLYVSFLQNMLKGKNPQALSNTSIPHTWANVDDNARALVNLATNEDCYGDVWHLPVGDPITLDAITQLFNHHLNKTFKASILPKFMINILSLFITPIREVKEMKYQFDQPYVMSWEKFKNRFPEFSVMSYEEGIGDMIKGFSNPSS